MSWFRRHYGASPLHLAGHIAAFAVAAWAIVEILGGGTWVNWVVWFVGAALLHDFVLVPVYSALDRGIGVAGRHHPPRFGVPVINHLRVPAAISGILLIVYFPLILGLSSTNYRNDTGHNLEGYTRNWLLITASLFLGSAIIYVIRDVPRRQRGAPLPPLAEQPGEQARERAGEQPGD
ncbi:MAG: hypothetical protein WAK93_21840 [Solirubrobacteraceae bacterium]